MLVYVCDSLYLCAGVYILIAAGALMMVVGFLGCCGAIQESPCMLGMVCTIFCVLHLTNIKRKLFKTVSYTISGSICICHNLTQQHMALLLNLSKCGL